MRSIFVLLILVMIGLNGKGQSVTALPDSVLSQCCLEVTLLNGNVTTVDWVFVQYITRDGTGAKLFVEYAPNFGGIQWETQIRIQDDFDNVLERSKFIVIPFTVGSTDYGINRNWIANIEENTTTGGTWIYGRFGTPTKRKFSAVEDYETMKNLLLACRPRAIVVAENGLYTEGDTVRMGGFLIEPTTITTEGYNWQMKDTLSSVEFGLDYLTPETLDTTVYWARRHGSLRQMVQLGRRYYYNSMRDTTGGLYSDFTHSWNSGDPFLQYQTFNPSAPTTGTAWFKIQKDNSFLNLSNDATNPFYSLGWAVTNSTATLGASESGSGDPGNGVVMGAYGFGTTEYLFMKTKRVDAGTATAGQFLQLINASSAEVDFATIDLSAYLPIADTAAMLDPYIQGVGTINRVPIFTGSRVIGNSNIQDNGTAVSILNSKPFQFAQWTTAGRPTGTTGYTGYNTTTNGLDWYNGTRWATGLESTFARGTATYVPYFDVNGQVTENSGIRYASAGLFIDGAAFTDPIVSQPVQFGATNSSVTTQKVYIQPKTGFGPLIGLQNGSKVGFVLMNSSGANEMAIGTYSSDQVHIRSNNTQRMTFYPTAQVDAVGLTNTFVAVPSIANTSFFTFSGASGNSPYLGITNGTIRAFGAGIEGTDGSVFGSYSNHPTSIRAGGNITRVRIGIDGSLNQVNTTTGLFLASGTTAQTPTEAGGLIRFNSDSTLYQIYSNGVRSYIATRAYVRSLATGRTGTARTIPYHNNSGTYTYNTYFKLDTTTTAGTLAKYKLNINNPSNLTNEGDAYQVLATYAGNAAATSGMFTVGDQAATMGTVGYNSVFQLYRTGGTFASKSNLSAATTVGSYSWRGQVGGTSTALGNITLSYLGNGTTTRSSMSFNVATSGGITAGLGIDSVRTVQFPAYGTGTKEAADLSKTQSNYIAGFATDGTVLDLKIGTGLAISGGELTATATAPTQILAESYNRITSTSSPQTFSSSISDNVVDQGGTQASFTFDFPASPVDGQVLTMTWNNAISTLTLNGNGNTIVGTAVTTAVAGTQRKFKYCGTCSTPAWIKIY